MQHAVVIGSTPAALRFAAGLARSGVVVRYLGTSARPSGPVWGDGAIRLAQPDSPWVERLWGPVVAVADGAMPEGHLSDTVVLDRERRRDRLATALGLAPASGLWVPRQPDGADDAIIDGGGDALHDVSVEGFEFDQGRVTGVITDHGYEHIVERLFVDARPRDLPRWCELPLSDNLSAALEPLHGIQVTLPAQVDALPWRTRGCDRLGFGRLTRPGLLPGQGAYRGHVTAHLEVAEGSPVAEQSNAEIVAMVRAGVAQLTEVGEGPAIVQRLPWGVARGAKQDTLPLQRAMNAMGITPLPRVLGHQHAPDDEARWLGGVLGNRG